jgi:hypothetical protein
MILTTCSNKIKENEMDKNGYISKPICAELSYNNFMPMKTIYFEIDNILYSLTVIDGEDENKVFDLRCENINNLDSVSKSYVMRTEYYDNYMETTILVDNDGYIAKYLKSESKLEYEKF